jgi:Protein of unknown function (DUF3618)
MTDTSKASEPAPRQVRRTPDEIERDIEATRERLATTVDELATRVKPKNLARAAGETARAQVVDPSGALRTDRVAMVAALVMLFAALSLLRRRRRSD